MDDSSAFVVGTDYYIYLVWDGTNVAVKISANSTYPSGYTSDNSRKIGGFHYGHIRKVSADDEWVPIDSTGVQFGANGVIWQRNVAVGIVPNSVWDLKNRPSCSPEGMVKVGNMWYDIYLASTAETVSFQGATNGLHVIAGKLQSKYGQLPITGTEGLHWFNFNELATRIGKRLPSYGERIKGAYGNPGGEAAADNYGWTKTTNTARARTGASVGASSGAYDAAAGIKPYAVSAYNLIDTVGDVWEWLDELGPRVSTDDAVSTFAWRDVLGSDKGQAYLASTVGLAAFIAGGLWSDGVDCGSRSVNLGDYPWSMSTCIGCRLACDAL
jgi:formylglycine-generating enzyme required for sulfatase activity